VGGWTSELAEFLKKRHGELTYAQLAQKLGITFSTLFRLEQGQQSITLRWLEALLERLKCKLRDVFKDDFTR
jgi:DNA-binding Xre family transcriptional regulator